METGYIYNKNFNDALEKLKQIRDIKVLRSEDKDNSIIPLFHCGDKKYRVYCDIVDHIERFLIHVTRNIIIQLLNQYEIEYMFYPMQFSSVEIEKMFQQSQSGCKVMCIINENDKRIGYILRNGQNQDKYLNYLNEGKIDEIRFINIKKYSKDAYEIINEMNEYNRKCNIAVSYCSIKDFFTKYFSEEEYDKFEQAVTEFNEKANVVISYTTVVAPTTWAIEKFKNSTLKEIEKFEYKVRARQANIHESNYNKIYETYIDKGVYRVLVSKEKFAESFFASEWNYQMYVLSENLDMTGIVVGYLKSIEQLLYFIANYYIESGEMIKLIKPKSDEAVYYTKEIDINKTVGWLKSFVNNNKDLIYISSYVNKFIEKAIQSYTNVNRNPLSHKEIIKNIDRVNEIRNDTIFLYFLILGSCRFSEEDITKILQ